MEPALRLPMLGVIPAKGESLHSIAGAPAFTHSDGVTVEPIAVDRDDEFCSRAEPMKIEERARRRRHLQGFPSAGPLAAAAAGSSEIGRTALM